MQQFFLFPWDSWLHLYKSDENCVELSRVKGEVQQQYHKLLWEMIRVEKLHNKTAPPTTHWFKPPFSVQKIYFDKSWLWNFDIYKTQLTLICRKWVTLKIRSGVFFFFITFSSKWIFEQKIDLRNSVTSASTQLLSVRKKTSIEVEHKKRDLA